MGDHLRARRLDLGLTQKQVAERVGADEATVNNWEKGNTAPSLRFIPGIYGFLGYDPGQEPADGFPGARIASKRRALGISRRRLAAELGVDEGTISRWERGKSRLRPTHRLRGLFEGWLARPATSGR